MRVPDGWASQYLAPRRAAQYLTLLKLIASADHSGRVRGFSKAALSAASGVHARQVRYHLAQLESKRTRGEIDVPPAIERVAVFAPQQQPNDYFVLVPWVVKARESTALAMQFGADSPDESRPTPSMPESRDGVAAPDIPDPPPRKRTSTLDAAAVADYWRQLNPTRFRG